MECERVKEKIHLYFDKQMTEPEAKDVEDHLRECEECQKELHIWDSITSAIQDIPMIEPSSSFVKNLVNSLPDTKFGVNTHSHIILWIGQFCMGIFLFALCWIFRDGVYQFIHFWGMHISNILFGAMLNLQVWKTVLWIAVGFVITIACLQITSILEPPNSKKSI